MPSQTLLGARWARELARWNARWDARWDARWNARGSPVLVVPAAHEPAASVGRMIACGGSPRREGEASGGPRSAEMGTEIGHSSIRAGPVRERAATPAAL